MPWMPVERRADPNQGKGRRKMRKILIFLLVLMLGFLVVLAAPAQEKKIYWRFSIGYDLALGTNSIRPSWDLGFLRFYDYQTPYDYNIDIGCEPWIMDRWFDFHIQGAPAPNDYYWFTLIGKVPEFYLKPGDRVILGGFSRTTYKNIIPQINLGWDLKLAKHLFFSLDVFARQDELRTEEEGSTIFIKQIWGPYYELNDQLTDWYLDTVIEHYVVNLKINRWNVGISPSLKLEIPLSKYFSVFPRAGLALGFSRFRVRSDWLLNYQMPTDFTLRQAIYFDESTWMMKLKKNEFVILPIVGLDIGIKGILLGAELQFGAGKQFPVENFLYYNGSVAQKARFVEIDEYFQNKYQNFRKGYYGTPEFNDFLKLNRAIILRISVGGRF